MPPDTLHGSDGSLLLSRTEIAALVDLDDVIEAVERAFALHARGDPRAGDPGLPGRGRWVSRQERVAAVAGVAASRSRRTRTSPTTGRLPGTDGPGVIVLFDGDGGFPLAVMDSIEITILRTAAATAVAARHRQRGRASTLTICGCGDQARAQVLALACVRELQTSRATSIPAGPRRWPPPRRRGSRGSRDPGLPAGPRGERDLRDVHAVPRAVPRTAGPRSRHFRAAVGADWPEKQELEADLVRRAPSSSISSSSARRTASSTTRWMPDS